MALIFHFGPVWPIIEKLTEDQAIKLLRLTNLIPEEEEAIDLLYGISTGKRRDLERVATMLGVSPLQVEVLEKTAAEKLAQRLQTLRRTK